MDASPDEPARTITLVRKCGCADTHSGRLVDLAATEALPGTGHVSSLPGSGVAVRLVLRITHRTYSQRGVRLGAALFLFPQCERVPGGRYAAWVVSCDRRSDRVDDRGVAEEPSRAGFYP